MPRNLREVLRGQMPDEELKQVRAFDIVGNIAVVKIPEKLLPKKQLIGQALMQVHHHVRTVLNQTTPVRGEFRTRKLEVIAGEPRTETTHREGGCSFKVDLAKVYFSPRLATERLRVTKQIKPGEVVTNLFAGVGCYSVLIAKHSEAIKIYSIDKNPAAVNYMRENTRINKVGARVVPILGDARDVVKTRLMGKADRVLMPLPELAREFFDVALLALKPEGGVVHFYDFGKEPELFGPSLEFVRAAAATKGKKVELLGSRAIRSYATRVYHIVLDLKIT
ncbi:MAG: class I SAM-dependent methyltransferase family protein [Hadesarchaea archaeon]|nr:MAG: class I SAM-dependent methyltransferase family protein [Hadesarchaea archaeon]